MLVHPATSNEEGELLARLASGLGSGNLDHRIFNRDFSDAAVAEPFAVPLAEIEQADVVVIVGSNVRHELPLLHARLRKAQTRNGARIHAINPVDFDFAFGLAGKQVVALSQFASALFDASLRDAVKGASRAVVIVGGLVENHPQAATLRAAVRDFASATGAALCRIPQGANAVGLARQGVLPTARGATAMLAQPRSAYVIYGIEPGLDFADAAAARAALHGAKVVAFSQFACASTRDVADVILPIGALPEIDASLTSLDGRVQVAKAGGKLPVEARGGLARAACPRWRAWPGRFRIHRSRRPARRPAGSCGDAEHFGAACAGGRGPGSGRHRRDLPHRCGGPSRCRAAGPSAQRRPERHDEPGAGARSCKWPRVRWSRSAPPRVRRRCR